VAELPWLALLTACLPVLVVAVRAAAGAGHDVTVAGDYAVLELGTRSALHLDQFLGPYSRYQWNHPGPLMFFAAAPFYGLTGTEAPGMGLGAAVWNLALVAAIVIIADAAGGRRWAWAAAVTLVAFALAYGPEQLADPWNPTMTVLPTAAIVVAGAAYAAGRRWALPALAVFSTMAVQTHIGSLPVAAAVTGAAVIVGTIAIVRSRRREGGDDGDGDDGGDRGWPALVRPGMVAVALLAVLWAPPVWQQLTDEPGNLGELVAFARRDDTAPPHDLQQSFEAATELVDGVHRPVGRVVREVGPTTPLPDLSTAEWSLGAVLAAALVAAVVLGILRRRWFGAAVAGLAVLAWAASVIAARQAEGTLYLYLLAFASGVGIAAWLGVAGAVAELLPARFVERAARWVPALGLSFAAVVAVDAARGALPLERYTSPELAGLTAAGVAAARADGADEARVRIVDNSQWPAAAAVAVALEDAGVDVTVEDPWTFMFGQDRGPSGNEDLLLSVGRADRPPPTRDDELLATASESALYGAPEVHPGPAADPAPVP